jgi:hypothetical protein
MEKMRPRLLIISAVLPFPGESGQQRRVAYKLRAFREEFEVAFLTFAPPAKVQETGRRLADHCDAAIVLPSRYWESQPRRLYHRAVSNSLTIWSAASSYRLSESLMRSERRILI